MTVKEDGMFAKNSITICLVGLFGLALVNGCKTFSGRNLDDAGYAVPETPAQKRQPRSLTDLTAGSPDMPPTPLAGPGSADQPRPLPEADPAKIGLDDVTLQDSPVHVEAGADIEDLEQDAQQLPRIVESAVHPFSEISQPLTISDQAPAQLADSQPTTYPIQTTQQAPQASTQGPPATTLTLGASPQATQATPPTTAPGMAGGPQLAVAPTNPPVQDDSPPPIVSRQQAEATARASADGGTQIVRIIADSGGDAESSTTANSTDRLFGTPPSADEKPQGDVSIVLAGTESGGSQQAMVQRTSHETLLDSPPSVAGGATAGVSAAQVAGGATPLLLAIQQRQQALAAAGESASLEDQVALQLLRIVAGQESLDSLQFTPQQEPLARYWNEQLTTLAMILQRPADETSEMAASAARRRRITDATGRLGQAHAYLASLATLRLPQCQFASEVRGFGQFTPLPTAFNSGQQVLIYCEIENYTLRETDFSGEIQQVAELQGQYSIIDANNRVVFQHQYQPVKDMCQRRRHDFYMFFPLTIPNLPLGTYRLQLSVEDLVGNKVASPGEDMMFNVVGNGRSAVPPQVANNPGQRPPTNQPLPMGPAKTPLTDQDLPPVVRR